MDFKRLSKKQLIIVILYQNQQPELAEIFQENPTKFLQSLLKLEKQHLLEAKNVLDFVYQILQQKNDPKIKSKNDIKNYAKNDAENDAKFNAKIEAKNDAKIEPKNDAENDAKNDIEKIDENEKSLVEMRTSRQQETNCDIIINNKNNNINNKENKENNNKIIMQKQKKNSEPFLLATWYYGILGMPGAIPTKIDMKHFKELLRYYPIDLIKQGIEWRLRNDPDGYWNLHITPAAIYRNFNNWMKEANFKPMTFDEFLDKNPELDYRKIQDSLMKAETFMKAWSIAKRNALVRFSEQDFERKKKALEALGRVTKKHLNGD